ncbi:MAG: 1-acyl-sn-glycerol-3-phosphate acyltransferase [Caldiserica bacterium]|nr:MAG: 1-acyl-sn-glycerol-3-phosphate acyltransferase [Caldisericota bacterium]
MFYKILHIFFKFFFRLFFHLDVYGVENVPKTGGVIVTPNHRSFLDIPVTGVALTRRMCSLGKKEVISESRLGWLYQMLGGIPLDMDRSDLKGLRNAVDVLKQGNPLLIFPEGTRSLTREVGPIKKGVVFLSFKAGVPIVPVGIVGAGEALHKTSKMIKLSHLVVVFGKPIKLWELFDPKDNSFYKKSTEYLRKEIKKCVELAEEKL